MFIQCPQCRSLISSSDEQLDESHGMVRCDYCGFYFTGKSANTTLAQQSNVSESSDEHSPQAKEPDLNQRPALSGLASGGSFDYEEIYTTEHKSKSSLSTAAWSIIILIFIMTLLAQYIYFNRSVLAKHDVIRPFLEQLCAVSDCQIPKRRDLTKIIIVERDIRSHPTIPNALQVSIIINNIATFVQPFPKIQLGFYDINGALIARRRFDPDEYLANTIDIDQGMPPQIPVFTNMEIIDPDEAAMNFKFEFF